jgi:CRISPR/Cas system CSM-associated protein Csm4 (group 5 of RAMP superfamily)
MGKEKMVKVRGQEFFQGQIAFQVQVPKENLDIVLGALKLLQNFGIGANTSMGFGYCSIKVGRGHRLGSQKKSSTDSTQRQQN